MESLLRWGIENSTPSSSTDPAPTPRKDLDPAIIDLILGKPDAQLMKEALAVAVDALRTDDERVAALDEFEMLIEQIDNANNLEKLQMWKTLQDLLESPVTSGAIKTQALWVIGTALQNNPAAQNSYLAYSPLPTLTSFLLPGSDLSPTNAETRSKAVYALSGLLKHNAAAVLALSTQEWEAIRGALEDSNIAVRRKTAFLLNSLLIPAHPIPTPLSPNQPVHPNSHASMLRDPASTSTSPITLVAIRTHRILEALISGLVTPVPHGPDGDGEVDPDFEEKGVRLLHTYAVECQGDLSPAEKRQLGAWLDERIRVKMMEVDADTWGLTSEEILALNQTLR